MRRHRSISIPIILGATSVALSIALLVGWTLIVVKNLSVSKEVAQNLWLLVAGIISLAAIISVLVLFSVFLVREILEVRRQNHFIDSVTHELKSPLASLKLGLQTLDRPALPDQQQASIRAMMHQDVERLDTFIEDILAASRIGHGRAGQTAEEVEVGEVLARARAAVVRRYRLPADAVTLAGALDTHIVTDVTAFETVIKNLVDNAVKYSNVPVRVQVDVSACGERVQVDVRDHGIGIPTRQLKRVSNRFYRVPAEAVRKRRGTGLGLYVVRALVRSMGGELHLDSAGEGQGTTASVRTPRVVEKTRP